MKVNERVREIRKSKNITQTHVAKSIPIPIANYNKMELGLRPLRVEWIEPISRALGVHPADLFCTDFDDTSNFVTEDGGVE